MYIYMYIYICMYTVYVCIFIYIYTHYIELVRWANINQQRYLRRPSFKLVGGSTTLKTR